ncbi:5-oxoprolinase subunit B family protein [Methylobacterium dankookense]|uniref:5-oxoprolinase subunit B n=1 Tax=Methylobacterium dankookense TaxID=560405 RepID=A0A564G746_9HYPH|nr:allophanate hydrolase subunit 1 [Methylobacterium dankookense]GJD55769.1 5-oxoprolinase subunit B [Methylobacterium dankookense]VUF15846.1 Kinase A inhibitor [Methylobacterium dankookense]
MAAPGPDTGGRPRFLDAGEAALVVEFGARVDPALNDRVLALDAALNAKPPRGLAETVPTYRSLMIHYDPLALSRDALVAAVEGRLAEGGAARAGGRRWTIPCCYDPAFAEDIAEVADLAGRDVAAVAALHAEAEYRVYMYGFAPGFAYLGGLPEALALPRRPSPRPPHPPGAVMIGGGLAAIGTFPMPTGWYVLARTPERLFAEGRDPAFLIESGDTLRFEPVDAGTFTALERRAAGGEIVARVAA